MIADNPYNISPEQCYPMTHLVTIFKGFTSRDMNLIELRTFILVKKNITPVKYLIYILF